MAPPIAPRTTALHTGRTEPCQQPFTSDFPGRQPQPRPGPVLEMTLDTAITDTGRREHAGYRLEPLLGPGHRLQPRQVEASEWWWPGVQCSGHPGSSGGHGAVSVQCTAARRRVSIANTEI